MPIITFYNAHQFQSENIAKIFKLLFKMKASYSTATTTFFFQKSLGWGGGRWVLLVVVYDMMVAKSQQHAF
jgi:hypothetical protein